MNILIDICHPAHVHLFKNFYFDISKNNNVYVITKKNLGSATYLLQKYNIPYYTLGGKSDKMLIKAFKQLKYTLDVLNIIKTKKIQIGIGTSITLAHASKISKMKSFIFDDDDDLVQPLFKNFAHPFCDFLFSPESLKGLRKKNTIYYPSFHELAYLHPNRFTPHSDIFKKLRISKNTKYFILRFNAFKAHHDYKVKGISNDQKLQLIELLSNHGRVFITSEYKLSAEFQKYHLDIDPVDIHSALFYANIFIGDSQTMTAEAALLGTPSIKCNSFAGRIAVHNELENEYGLCYSFLPEQFNSLLIKLNTMLNDIDLKKKWNERKIKLLTRKKDLTAIMLDKIAHHFN